ncbi:hypothetical protein, partial [Saccharomonospora saliphila]|uniref:hypothetical protein n=1 Tax=Saccharomonospora saliphila TaxID=369829 RepID=UPI001E512484
MNAPRDTADAAGHTTPAATGDHTASPANAADYTVVVPTTGRALLTTLLRGLDAGRGPAPAEIIVVDDRPPRR